MKDNKEILEDVKLKIAISNFEKGDTRKMPKFNIGCLKELAVACMFAVSISGMVFAKDISTKVYENFFFTGNGIGKAIEEGYIEKSDMEEQVYNATAENEETGQIIEDTETKVKIDEFLMDDFNLSITFDVVLSDKIKDIVNPSKIIEMNFPDLVIYDENNVVIYCLNGVVFDDFCEKKNLGYNCNTVPDDKYIGSGFNTFVGDKNGNNIKVVYNIYTGGGSLFPKSKELYFNMSKIRLSENETMLGDEEIAIKGDWNFKANVPEKMYNRTSVAYCQKSTTNDDFNVTEAVLYDTGMDITLRLKTGQLPKEPLTPKLEFYNTLTSGDELRSIDILNYIEYEKLEDEEFMEEYNKYNEEFWKFWKFEKYLENEKGESFNLSEGPSENGGASVDDDGIMIFKGMFDLTKYDATDTIVLHVDRNGNKADIVLEKVR